MPRLFVAVWPPGEVLDAVGRLPRSEVPGLRWTGREHWHVTLRFLGAVEDPGRVVEALRGLAVERAEAEVGPAVGLFGNRVLHVPVAGLDGLEAAVREATAALGRPPEDRPFSGHVTLARVATGARVDLARLTGTAVSGRWIVRDLCLVESRLAPTGARYEVLQRVPLLSP